MAENFALCFSAFSTDYKKSVTRRIRIYAGNDKGIAHGKEPVMVFDGGLFRYNYG